MLNSHGSNEPDSTSGSSLADLSAASGDTREDTVRKGLSARLKVVCENLSATDFQALLSKMTREQLRGEGNPVA